MWPSLSAQKKRFHRFFEDILWLVVRCTSSRRAVPLLNGMLGYVAHAPQSMLGAVFRCQVLV